jgi:hypothetical protein
VTEAPAAEAAAQAPASPAPAAPRANPVPRSAPVQAERHEPARVVLTEAPLAAAVATAFSLPPLPPIPEKPATPASGTPVAETVRQAEANPAAGETDPPRKSAPSVAIVEEQDSADTSAPIQAATPAASTEPPAEAPHAPVNGHGAVSPVATQPRQGDLLGHADATGATPPLQPAPRPVDASAEPEEEDPRQDAAP